MLATPMFNTDAVGARAESQPEQVIRQPQPICSKP